MLPQFGFAEFLVLAILALVVVGPRELPLMMRRVGGVVRKAREMGREFQRSFDEIGRQAELDELRQEIQSLKRMEPLDDVRKPLEDLRGDLRDVDTELRNAGHPSGGRGEAVTSPRAHVDEGASTGEVAPSPQSSQQSPQTLQTPAGPSTASPAQSKPESVSPAGASPEKTP